MRILNAGNSGDGFEDYVVYIVTGFETVHELEVGLQKIPTAVFITMAETTRPTSVSIIWKSVKLTRIGAEKNGQGYCYIRSHVQGIGHEDR